MKATRIARIAPLALSAGLALTFALPGQASPAAGPGNGPQAGAEHRPGHGMQRGEHSQRGEHHGQGRHQGGKGGERGMMRELNLTDAQKDQIFALRHAAMPELRNAMKTARASQKALREMAQSGEFDATKAEALAQAGAAAMSNASLTRARMQADVVALLTPEQRAKAQAWQAEHGQRGHGGQSRRGGMGMMP